MIKVLFILIFIINPAFSRDLILYKIKGDQIEFEPCPDRPNCINSQEDHIQPFVFKGESKDVFRKLNTYLEKKEGVRILKSDFPFVHAVYKSSLFKFKDDVLFFFEKDKIHMRSSSRSGYYDFDANRNRLEKFKEEFKY